MRRASVAGNSSPYASNVEDSDLELSYDLYYLRHFSTWLDLVICSTVKTVLKARRWLSALPQQWSWLRRIQSHLGHVLSVR